MDIAFFSAGSARAAGATERGTPGAIPCLPVGEVPTRGAVPADNDTAIVPAAVAADWNEF